MNSQIDDEKVQEIVDRALCVIKEKLVTIPLYAEIICGQLIKAVPDFAEGYMLMGLIKQQLEQYQESIDIIKKAIELDPENADNYNNMALSLANVGKYDEAVQNLSKAISLKNNYLYYNNLALQYRQLRQYDKAIDLFDRAIELNESRDPQLWNNLGGIYGELKDLEKAEECFLTASRIDPTFSASHVDLAFTYHLMGDWVKGFQEYEWRVEHFQQLNHYKKHYDMSKKWNGVDSLAGKDVLVYGEQGMGDVIQFSRYLKCLKNLGANRVILHCHKPIESLMKRIEGVDETFVADIVNDKEIQMPEYDYQCMLMSLPHLLQEYQPTGEPYLESVSVLPFNDYKDYFKVGIIWAGSPAHPNDSLRSMFLKEFKPIHNIEGVKLFNLQVDYRKRIYTKGKKIVDLTDDCEDMSIVDLTSMIEDFDDTATVVSGLDLVIAVDTAVVHLCGALGIPCWMLVHYNPDWRWGIDGKNTCWYDSVSIYRQNVRDSWSEVMERVRDDILLLQNK